MEDKIFTADKCQPMPYGFVDYRGTPWSGKMIDMWNRLFIHHSLRAYIGRDMRNDNLQALLDQRHSLFVMYCDIERAALGLTN